jgi:hypothetical protein
MRRLQDDKLTWLACNALLLLGPSQSLLVTGPNVSCLRAPYIVCRSSIRMAGLLFRLQTGITSCCTQ